MHFSPQFEHETTAMGSTHYLRTFSTDMWKSCRLFWLWLGGLDPCPSPRPATPLHTWQVYGECQLKWWTCLYRRVESSSMHHHQQVSQHNKTLPNLLRTVQHDRQLSSMFEIFCSAPRQCKYSSIDTLSFIRFLPSPHFVSVSTSAVNKNHFKLHLILLGLQFLTINYQVCLIIKNFID